MKSLQCNKSILSIRVPSIMLNANILKVAEYADQTNNFLRKPYLALHKQSTLVHYRHNINNHKTKNHTTVPQREMKIKSCCTHRDHEDDTNNISLKSRLSVICKMPVYVKNRESNRSNCARQCNDQIVYKNHFSLLSSNNSPTENLH